MFFKENTEKQAELDAAYERISELEDILLQKEKIISELKDFILRWQYNLNRTRSDVSGADVIRLKNKGMSNYKIAKSLNCSEGTVRNRLRSYYSTKTSDIKPFHQKNR